MNLKRKSVASPRRISLCGTLIVLLVLNASMQNCQLVMAAKEEVDDHGLLIKSEDLTSSDDDLATLESMEGWKPICFSVPNIVHSNNPMHFNDEGIYKSFNPFGGGKRSGLTDYIHRMSLLTKKGGFNPWGGKRDSPTADTSRSSKNEYPSSRRLPFNPWGG